MRDVGVPGFSPSYFPPSHHPQLTQGGDVGVPGFSPSYFPPHHHPQLTQYGNTRTVDYSSDRASPVSEDPIAGNLLLPVLKPGNTELVEVCTCLREIWGLV